MPVTKKMKGCKNTKKSRENLQLKEFKYMIKILFICYGNICRSPMAEFILKHIV